MLFEYSTQRLLLKIIKPQQADQVLDFYLRDKKLFEQFEPERMENFYTSNFQKKVLSFEGNMTAQGSLFRFYVYEKHNPDRIIGTICIHHINRGFFSSCEIGYKFSSACHHMGYATESMQRIIAIAFGELKLHRITAWVLPDNVPSIRLLGRLGFQFEGICRDYLLLQGKWRDHAQYSLLSDDYSSANGHIQ
ncbi:MAG: GNAT family protein [Lachnospiraceae bacterium]|nr:GNAT family N-acetyltransferase [Agathobacter sp.]MDD6290532.1 GNAT family protein [Lachnospiraceae bacterium]